MNWKELDKTSGLVDNVQMDEWLTHLGFSQKSIQTLYNPCELHSPKLLDNCVELCEALQTHIKNNEKIRIMGDYDMDGVGATSILYLALSFIHARVDYDIPHRIRNGYGLCKEMIDKALDDNIKAILTCDNGIACHEVIDYAREKGLYVYVTDHHTPSSVLPNANLIVHPQIGAYPFPYISGAQVAYKVASLLLDNSKALKKKKGNLRKYLLQLSALTIVSDVMPIASADDALSQVNENRKWLMDGIKSIQTEPDWHLKMLMDYQEVNQETFDEQSIGFSIAPAINAVGRLHDAKLAVDFLTTDNKEDARRACSFIVFLNEERKDIKKQTMERIHLDESTSVNFIAQEGIHEGIIGILAGAYMNENNKTTLVMTDCMVDGQKAWKGSARGNSLINLYDTLQDIDDRKHLLYAYGGHADAAGLTVLDENLEEFKQEFCESVEKQEQGKVIEKTYVQIHNRKERLAFVEEIKKLKPFGNGLPLPIAKMSFNVSRIDLYYKSNHAKMTQYEMVFDHGKKSFPALELWLFGGLKNVKPICNEESFTMSDNVQRIMERDNVTENEAREIRAETYQRKKDKKANVNYLIEVGYTDFNGVGARYNVLEVDKA